MSLLNLLPQSVTIARPSAASVDAEGNPVSARTTSSTVPARIQQVSSTESLLAEDRVTDKWLCFLPAGTDITAGDEILEGVRRYVVDGNPNRVWGASSEHHVEAVLRLDAITAAPTDTTEPTGYGESGYGLGYYGGSAA